MSSKVLLVNPLYLRSKRIIQHRVDPPLGISYIAAVLRNNGYDVRIIDCHAEHLEIAPTVDRIVDFKPDIVGFTATTPSVMECSRVAKLLKSKLPEVKTVVGGPHPTAVAEDCLKRCNEFDFSVFGEGENTMLELANALQNNTSYENMPGLCYRNGDTIVKGPERLLIDNLDSLPMPARDLLPMHLYRGSESFHYTAIMCARGCPFHCTYCSSFKTWTRQVRFRSVQNICDEMEEVQKRWNVRRISFFDDTFTLYKKWAMSFCEEVQRRGINKTMYWDCLTRCDNVDKDVLKAMKAAGCVKIMYGVESGSQQILDEMQRGMTKDTIRKAFKMTHELDIPILAFAILGMPGETKETIKETEKFIFEIEPDQLHLSYATPYPGTDLHDTAEFNSLIKSYDWEQYYYSEYTGNMKRPKIDDQEIINYMLKINRKFYMRPKFILKLVKWFFQPQNDKMTLTKVSVKGLKGIMSLWWTHLWSTGAAEQPPT